MNWIEEKIAQVEKTTYEGAMPSHNKQVLRQMLEKEDAFWVREGADFIRGFDDGEPQTVTDYNHGQE